MAAGVYQYITFAEAKRALAQRLDDPNFIHWSNAELGLYLQEALTVWQALTGYARSRGTFALSNTVAFYDITELLQDAMGNYLLSMNVTDTEVITEMEYMLLEPPTIPWTGTTQFTLAELTYSLQRARDAFLVETGSVITYSVINGPSPPSGSVQLDDHVIDVRRAAWAGVGA